MGVPRIVIDTNVLVAALRSRRGTSYQLVSLIGSGKFSLHLSVPLVLEYEEVMLRYEADLSVDAQDIGLLLDYLCTTGEAHNIFFLWRPILKDPGDDMVLELAVNAACDYIVTFNLKDFVGLERFGIEALTPRNFLAAIGESL